MAETTASVSVETKDDAQSTVEEDDNQPTSNNSSTASPTEETTTVATSDADDTAEVDQTEKLVVSPWSFEPVRSPLTNFSSKVTQDLLQKWGLDKWTYTQRYSYVGAWDRKEAKAFLTEFLNSPAARVSCLIGALLTVVMYMYTHVWHDFGLTEHSC